MWAEMLMCVIFLIAIELSSQASQNNRNAIPPGLSQYPQYFPDILADGQDPALIERARSYEEQKNKFMDFIDNKIEADRAKIENNRVNRIERAKQKRLIQAKEFREARAQLRASWTNQPQTEQVNHPIQQNISGNDNEAKRMRIEQTAKGAGSSNMQTQAGQSHHPINPNFSENYNAQSQYSWAMQNQHGQSHQPAGSSSPNLSSQASQDDRSAIPPKLSKYPEYFQHILAEGKDPALIERARVSEEQRDKYKVFADKRMEAKRARMENNRVNQHERAKQKRLMQAKEFKEARAQLRASWANQPQTVQVDHPIEHNISENDNEAKRMRKEPKDFSSQARQDKGNDIPQNLSQYPTFFQHILADGQDPILLERARVHEEERAKFMDSLEENKLQAKRAQIENNRVIRNERAKLNRRKQAKEFYEAQAQLRVSSTKQPQTAQLNHQIEHNISENDNEAKRMRKEPKGKEAGSSNMQTQAGQSHHPINPNFSENHKAQSQSSWAMQNQHGQSHPPAGSSSPSEEDYSPLIPNLHPNRYTGYD
ncbi:uncharacterized protein LOC117170732 [Belonocnema kinseyi]|uniref:uncharacterized protein LOC117170732 n=1 Tax=Belonocnema kinseyi TaxID=2817044 RepID=UPI00143D9508|nr:uncharacterized protein LOC117170732 [Belonocnema kinseyi]